MKLKLDSKTTKGLSIVTLSWFVALALITGCNKGDDSKGAPEVPRVTKVSVLGKSSAIGYFPDGHKAEPLSDAKMAKIVKMGEGMAIINGAVGNLTYDSGSKQNDRNRVALTLSNKFEFIQDLVSNPVFLETIRNPSTLMTSISEQLDPTAESRKNLEIEIKKYCLTKQVSPEPTVSGNDTQKHATQTGSTKIEGTQCPVDSDADYTTNLDVTRFSEDTGRLKGVVTFAGKLHLKAQDKQESLNFINESIKGTLGMEVVAINKSTELVFSLEVGGKLETKTQGVMEAKILADVYAQGTANDMTNLALGVTVVLNTAEGDILIQIKSTKEASAEQVTELYLNGVRIELKKQDLK